MTAFPKTLFVKREKDINASYFVPDTNPVRLIEMGEKLKIGVYKLVRIQEIEGTFQTNKVIKV